MLYIEDGAPATLINADAFYQPGEVRHKQTRHQGPELLGLRRQDRRPFLRTAGLPRLLRGAFIYVLDILAQLKLCSRW